MNRLEQLFQKKQKDVLSIYFSAGHPELNDTSKIVQYLDMAGADIVEIGIPFSDPVADGPIIQQSSLKALNNGISVKLIFEQLSNIREKTEIPIVLMGYLNPVFQYGVEKFCEKCHQVGVDGLILPDLPPELYIESYRELFVKNNIKNIMLVPPQTSDERIKLLDEWSDGFLYIVAASSTTGAKKGFQQYQIDYFERLQSLELKTPALIGFGISDNHTFRVANQYTSGAIIGSAFIKVLEEQNNNLKDRIVNFVKQIREKH
jgi:tryptophan synthase alpha chain